MPLPRLHKYRLFLLFTLGLLLQCGCGAKKDAAVVLWVTGNLQGEWLPQGAYNEPSAGGLSRLARALELYRQPDELLVDLGRFRYLASVSGATRRWRVQADGFIQALTRLNYTALNVSLQDLPPYPPDLADLARSYGLNLVSLNVSPALNSDSTLFPGSTQVETAGGRVRIFGLTGGPGEFSHWLTAGNLTSLAVNDGALRVLLTDCPEPEVQALCEKQLVDLVLWLNSGLPVARRVGETLLLGLGDSGCYLGRVEISSSPPARIKTWDVSGWLDGQPFRHHPAREALIEKLQFWKKRTDLKAYLWAIPEELTPHKQTEIQRRQSTAALRRGDEIEELQFLTPTTYAGSARCLDCHPQSHARDLAIIHGVVRDEVKSYPVYERCLPCHATGFDDPSGFLLPYERPDLLSVGCEACHSGGYTHALEGQPPPPPIPDSTVCQPCHSARAHPKLLWQIRGSATIGK